MHVAFFASHLKKSRGRAQFLSVAPAESAKLGTLKNISWKTGLWLAPPKMLSQNLWPPLVSSVACSTSPIEMRMDFGATRLPRGIIFDLLLFCCGPEKFELVVTLPSTWGCVPTGRVSRGSD